MAFARTHHLRYLLIGQNAEGRFALLPQGPSAGVVVVVRRPSQSERLEYLGTV